MELQGSDLVVLTNPQSTFYVYIDNPIKSEARQYPAA